MADFAVTVSGLGGWERKPQPDHYDGEALIDGVWYRGTLGPELFLYPRKHGNKVKCKCGSTSFGLHYGEYEILATCANCGACESVYSG